MNDSSVVVTPKEIKDRRLRLRAGETIQLWLILSVLSMLTMLLIYTLIILIYNYDYHRIDWSFRDAGIATLSGLAVAWLWMGIQFARRFRTSSGSKKKARRPQNKRFSHNSGGVLPEEVFPVVRFGHTGRQVFNFGAGIFGKRFLQKDDGTTALVTIEEYNEYHRQKMREALIDREWVVDRLDWELVDQIRIQSPLGMQVKASFLLRWLERVFSRQRRLRKGQGVSEFYWTTARLCRNDINKWGWQPYYYKHIRSIIDLVERARNVQIIYIEGNNWHYLHMEPREALLEILKFYFPNAFEHVTIGGGYQEYKERLLYPYRQAQLPEPKDDDE